LMLENRSFEHLVGYLRSVDPRVAGLTGNESDVKNPNDPTSVPVKVSRTDSFVMTFDPGHEFHDVQLQLYGPMQGTDPDLPPVANTPRREQSLALIPRIPPQYLTILQLLPPLRRDLDHPF